MYMKSTEFKQNNLHCAAAVAPHISDSKQISQIKMHIKDVMAENKLLEDD